MKGSYLFVLSYSKYSRPSCGFTHFFCRQQANVPYNMRHSEHSIQPVYIVSAHPFYSLGSFTCNRLFESWLTFVGKQKLANFQTINPQTALSRFTMRLAQAETDVRSFLLVKPHFRDAIDFPSLMMPVLGT